MPTLIALPAVLDIQSAEALRVQLLGARGRPLVLDGSAVERLGGLCLQVLLSARQTWAADGHGLVVNPASKAFTDQWNAFGAPAMAAGQPGDPA
ncbi:STAS domain-containing protein [Brevundimonas sp.]|uniref:STAS domain-containing protein n=1 Tax=Brevundimonas sp. TaxID=1871086 RepID=UPI002D75107B|nr:STAS domain-containing protein [Brevundimonas sp.]HYC96400.1 STAS domain-containing protein [Brevundimonas sp.]